MSDNRRTKLEVAEAIFKIINTETEPFAKSKLLEARLHHGSIDDWLELITYIQSQPKIRLIKSQKITLVEKVKA